MRVVAAPTDGFVDIGDVRLGYTEAGAGDPVLLLHGMACDRGQLRGQLEHLSSSHRCVSLDLRGHGDSDKPAGEYSTEVFVEDIRRAIERLDLGQPLIVGHSRGGSLALALAASYPGSVRALAMLDSGIRPAETRRRDLASFYDTLGGPDHADRVRAFVRSRLVEPTDGAGVIAQVEATMAGTPAHVFRAMGEGVLAFDSLVAAQRCSVPALLVLAGRSSFLDDAALSTLPDTWHIARVVGSGHFVQLVVPDQVNAMLTRFIALLPPVDRARMGVRRADAHV